MADPQSWTPKFDENHIRELVGQYNTHPGMFDGRDDDIEVLEDHAHHYRIPFARTKEHQDNFVSKVLKASPQITKALTTTSLLVTQ